MLKESETAVFRGEQEIVPPEPGMTPVTQTEQDLEQAEQELQRKQLIREINEQIPFLAYGLSEKLAESGLRGKVSVRGAVSESWGIGVSKNNPRKDIPNVITYPESVLEQERSVVNAQLRHEIGHLNHSIDPELQQLQSWCRQKGVNYQLILPLIEAVQEASVNYLEMQNSIVDDPAEAFRPLYREVINMNSVGENIGSGMQYKQAVDLTLIESLSKIGLIPDSVSRVAEERASSEVLEKFNPKTMSIIEQAVKSSSGRIKVQLVRDYLWPEFSKLITQDQMAALSSEQSSSQDISDEGVRKILDVLQKNQQLSSDEIGERQEVSSELLKELAQKLQELQNAQSAQNPQENEQRPQDNTQNPSQTEKNSSQPQTNENGQPNQLGEGSERSREERQTEQPREMSAEDIAKEIEKLQELIEELNDPNKTDQNESLDNLECKIHEIGINESELPEEQLDLLNRMRDFCQKTTVLYVKTMRFLMKEYQQYNSNFTDEMIEKMILRHHDTPSFTIYGKDAGKNFIENGASELGIEQFETDGFLLNFNLPDILGRFWYRGGNGKMSQPVPEGAIEWGHFYRSCMPVIWRSVDQTIMQKMLFDRMNEFGQHDWRKYYYLYDVNNLPFDISQPEQSGDDSGSGETDNAQSNSGQESEGGQDQDGESSDMQGENSSQGGAMEGSGGSSEMNGEGEAGSDSGGEMSSSGNGKMPDSGQGEGTGGESGQDDSGSGEGNGEGQGQGQDSSSKGEQFSGEGVGSGGAMDALRELQDKLSGDIDPSAKQQLQDLIDKLQQEMQESISEHETQGQGGMSNQRGLGELFSQLQETQDKIKSSFTRRDGGDIPIQEFDLSDSEIDSSSVEAIENLEAIKEQQQRQLEAIYREQSGLSGEALDRYIDYMEETRNFTGDLIEYFSEKFQLDTDYTYANNQRRGARLQKGWTDKMLGMRAMRPVIEPTVFERRSIPKSPQFVWSVIIDNSGSCSGEIIQEEIKTAVALTEVAKQLNIPLEIVTFGGNREYTFLKTFDQELFGDQLSTLVQLKADQGTPDVVTLNAACSSVSDFADQFNRSYNFVYFMTDGGSGSGSIQSVIGKFKRDMVITGVGLAGAAQSISSTWGKNSVGVEDVNQLSDVLIRKIEDQIEETFD